MPILISTADNLVKYSKTIINSIDIPYNITDCFIMLILVVKHFFNNRVELSRL